MMEERQKSDLERAVAHSWHATYNECGSLENIVLEIRHAPGHGFLLHTEIQEREYHISGHRFMHVVEELVAQLPPDATLTTTHQICMWSEGTEKLVQMEEIISSYRTGENVDPGYQLVISTDAQTYTTKPTPDAMHAVEVLVSQLPPGTYFKICAFCQLMFEDGMYGGTDGRHDLTYCFRDHRKVLETLRDLPRKSPSFPRVWLNVALQDVDILHTCSAFTLAEDFGQRMQRLTLLGRA